MKIRVHLWLTTKKPCAENRMAQPRFLRRHYPHQVQGVRSTFVVDHLSQAAPPHLFLVQNKTRQKDVKGGSAALSDDAKILAAFGCVNLTSSNGLLDPPPEFNVAQRRGYSGSIIISLLPPVLRSYERWPSTCPSPSSRPSRRCRCRKRPCPQTCPRPSPCKSRP